MKIIKLFIGDYISNNKNKMFILLFLTILYYILEVVCGSFLLQKIISNYKDKNIYILYLSCIILIFICIFNYLRGFFENIVISDINFSCRDKFFKAIINKYSESYKDVKIGDLLMRIVSATMEFRYGFSILLKNIFPMCLILLFSIFYIFSIDKYISLILFISFISLLGIAQYTSKYIYKYKGMQEQDYCQDIETLSNKFGNLFNTYINNKEDDEKKNIKKMQKNYSNLIRKADDVVNISNTSMKINICIFIFILAYYLYKTTNKIKPSKIILLSILISYFFSTSMKISIDICRFRSHFSVCNVSYNILDDLCKSQNNKTIKHIENGDIEISNLSLSYEKKHYIFKDVNLKIKKGSKLGIIGKSGSGKSSMAKLLLKFYNYEGTIKLNNINIQDIDTSLLRSKINYINQKTELLNISILENIKYGSNISNSDIIHYIKKYKLESIFSGLKKGIHEIVFVDGKNISLGMQKVILIMRGILKIKNSFIIIFDEPLAGLDKITREKVIKMILEECKGKTIIIITHDMEIIPYMDNTFTFNN